MQYRITATVALLFVAWLAWPRSITGTVQFPAGDMVVTSGFIAASDPEECFTVLKVQGEPQFRVDYPNMPMPQELLRVKDTCGQETYAYNGSRKPCEMKARIVDLYCVIIYRCPKGHETHTVSEFHDRTQKQP